MGQPGASRLMAMEIRPFGGFLATSEGKPGARGFGRLTADEGARQWSA
jgi:alpha-glucuronidase